MTSPTIEEVVSLDIGREKSSFRIFSPFPVNPLAPVVLFWLYHCPPIRLGLGAGGDDVLG